MLTREIDKDVGVVRVVFDDEEAQVTGLEGETVVGDRFGSPEPPWACRGNAASAGSGRGGVADRKSADGPSILHRQIEREDAATAGGAAKVDLAAQEVGELAADGESRPVPP